MIKVENESFKSYSMNLLCEFKEFKQNQNFSLLAKKAKENQILNKVIQESILKKLDELGLKNDERFLRDGFYFMKDKNLIDIKIYQYKDTVYIYDYSVIYKVTDDKYDGENAEIFSSKLNSYERYEQGNLDLSIDKIHEMGYYKSLESQKFFLEINNMKPKIVCKDKEISYENMIVKEVLQELISKIESSIPEYISVKSKKLYFSKYDKNVYNYLKDCFEENKLFTSNVDSVNITNEHIYLDNTKIAENFLVEYLKYLLRSSILTTKEMNNILNELLLLEEFDDIRLRINTERIKKSLNITINGDAVARKNLDFANDILEDNQKYLGKVIDLNNREGILREILINTFNLSKEVKDIYLVSKYLVSYSFEKDFNELNIGEQKKKMVFDELVKICDDYDINLHMNIDQKNRTYSSVDFNKIDFKTIHGRYLVVKSKEITAYKLDGELDHFERKDHNVVFKDLQVTRYSDISNINKVVLESVGV